jgi:hypothetical protein
VSNVPCRTTGQGKAAESSPWFPEWPALPSPERTESATHECLSVQTTPSECSSSASKLPSSPPEPEIQQHVSGTFSSTWKNLKRGTLVEKPGAEWGEASDQGFLFRLQNDGGMNSDWCILGGNHSHWIRKGVCSPKKTLISKRVNRRLCDNLARLSSSGVCW